MGSPIGRMFAPLRDNEILLVVSVSTLLVMLGQGVIGPVLPLFAKSLGVSAATVGFALSAFAIARMLVNLPSGMLADRRGRRLLLVAGPLITGVGSVASGLAPGIAVLLLTRFVAGVGSAMYMTGAAIVVTDIATSENRGRMLSVNQGALLLGVTLGPAIGGTVAEVFGLRAPFYLVGVAALAAAVWNFVRVPETRPTGAALARGAGGGRRAPGGPFSGLRLLLITNFALACGVAFATFFARSGRSVAIPLFADEELGWGEGAIGGLFALTSFINLLLIVPAGTIVDRLGAKKAIVPGALLDAAAFVLMPLSRSAEQFIGVAVLSGIGGGIMGPAPAAFAAQSAPPEARGAAMGLYRTLGDVGLVVSAPLVGYLSEVGGYALGLGINGAMLALAGLMFGLLATERRSPRSHR